MEESLPKGKTSAAGRHALSRGVAKVMGLFTGTQVFVILCSVIKMKLVAIWLQSAGVGLFGIYNTTVESIATITDLGLRQSAVRDAAVSARNRRRFDTIAVVIRRWSLAAGLLGAVVISALSPALSLFFFGNAGSWWCFALLSGVMLLNSLINGEQAILQGTGLLRRIVSSTLRASIAGLAVSIPMFRWLGESSVILSIIAYSVAGALFIYSLRYRTQTDVRPTRTEVIREGSSFVRLGAMMAVAAFAANMVNLLFIAFLSNRGSLTEVGYYQAGSTVVLRYVGLVFTAVGMEFYPRLAAAGFSKWRTRIFVNHEITLLLLVVTPVIMLFLLFRSLIVDLLYSEEFRVIIPFISWAVISSIFKAISWCMAYTIIAKGMGKIYMAVEITDCIFGLCLNILFYTLWGLEGIGYSYILWFFGYTLLTGTVYRRKFGLHLSGSVLRLSFLSLAICLLSLLAMETLPFWSCSILLGGGALLFVLPIRKMLNK